MQNDLNTVKHTVFRSGDDGEVDLLVTLRLQMIKLLKLYYWFLVENCTEAKSSTYLCKSPHYTVDTPSRELVEIEDAVMRGSGVYVVRRARP